ncbi:MAG: murein biosynthesis integral membrane protein MurJ [Candidatus Kerfeldbacteria bacterium RIFOXYC2_FULL_38_9]|nr:MAG: murein biosynthesis integral membrane protein MurJ [Candidatus Kerfeldbacteria bacterium RIFOXYC2_FULL_38_9]
MPKRLIVKLQQSIAGGALIIGSFSILSRILGLIRDRLLSTTFGANHVLDAYFVAFKIPDFLFNIFVLGVMSAAFVPVFIAYQKKNGNAEAMKIANPILNLIAASLSIIGLICLIFTPQLVSLLAFGDSLEQQALIVHFMRPMLLSLFFFGISNVLSGILHAYKQFFVYGLAPIMYNLGIIFGILFFVPAFGYLGLSYGVVLGSLLHLLIQLPIVIKFGFRYRLNFSLKHPGVRQILKLMPSRSFALGLTQLNVMVIFAIASVLSAGEQSAWQFADNLQHFPINIFGVSLALAVFPVFSEALAENNVARFKQVFSENFRRILFFIIPISIITLLLRAQIVRLIYGAGEFDWTATILTAQTLGAFALSMFAQSLIPLFARAFFAKQDTKTPVIISAVSMIINILLALWFVKPYGIIGLGIAFSMSAVTEMILLLAALRVRHGDLDDNMIITSTWKIVISSLIMGIIIQGMKYLVADYVDMQTFDKPA